MTKRILIVDDSSMVRALFRQALNGEPGFVLRAVCNGQEAMEAIRSDGEPDLMFLDVNMPLMDGLEFLGLQAGTGFTDRVVVVIVSTEGRAEDVQRGLKAGARAYLRKPFNPESLLPLVKKLLGTAKPTAAQQG